MHKCKNFITWILTSRILNKLMLKVLRPIIKKWQRISHIFGCLFQIWQLNKLVSRQLRVEKWIVFRLGVRTNAIKCRDLKQTRRYKLDFSRFCYCCCLFTLQFISRLFPFAEESALENEKSEMAVGRESRKFFFLSKQSLWNMSHILGWLFASKVSVKITNRLLISDPIPLLEHLLKDFFI